MIECFTMSSAPEAYLAQARLRYEALRNSGWSISFDHARRMDEDAYDHETTVYFLKSSAHGVPEGCLRLCRTDVDRTHNGVVVSFLLNDHFRRLCDKEALIRGPGYRASGRLCLSPQLVDRQQRTRCVDVLLVALLEYAVSHNIEGLYGVMPVRIFERTWGRLKCPFRFLGTVQDVDGDPCQAAVKLPTPDALQVAREITGLTKPVSGKDL